MKPDRAIGLDEIASIHSNPGKLYHSLGQIIRSKIQSGEWPVGEKIPSERTLMQVFEVSRATVRQAVDILIKEGILYRQHGKGTFAAPQKLKQGVLRLMDFTNLMRRNGLNPSASLLGKGIYNPPGDVRLALQLRETEQAYWFQRLIQVEDGPILIENLYFSADRFPDLLQTYDGAEDVPLFLRRQYGVQVVRESEVFEPVLLESHEAGLLGVKQGFPALWVEFRVYASGDIPLICGTSVLRGDRCRFYIDLTYE